MALTFEWDLRKARSNFAKHGVGFEEAATVTISDPEHSLAEVRNITMGRAFAGKLLVVVHTDRGDNIRIISVRRASWRERKSYEENTE
jgi:uncharacterized DUF497 family protein